MICFVGTTFAPVHLREAARLSGLTLTNQIHIADLVFISEDTPTQDGKRDLIRIRNLVASVILETKSSAVLVLTSQVPPGFTRSLGLNLYHMAETLRVKDAAHRAMYPEQFIVGCEHPDKPLPQVFLDYLHHFQCPVFQMTWEEAEFAKIAINMTLASQVENATRLSMAARKVGAKWSVIKIVLKHDRRIGPHSYLEPGDWKNSAHLLRDWVTLKEIENG